MTDINQEAIIETIKSDSVSEVRVSRGDELYPNEILIFCGASAHRKFTEIKSQMKKEPEPVESTPCEHDWNEDLVCTKCGADLTAGAGE